jgi:hypothetical protein
VTAMYCPVCARRLERDEFQPAYGTVSAHWTCVDCDCRVNSYDDEFEPCEDAPLERAN